MESFNHRNHHGTSLLWILPIVTLVMIVILTYWYISNQSIHQNQQPSYQPIPINHPITTPTSIPSSTIDFSCVLDSDCVVKTVGSKCPKPDCINKNYYQKQVTPQAGIACPMSILQISGCKCVNNSCHIVQNGTVIQLHEAE